MENNHKLRMTTQRTVILEELAKLKTHPTAGELCQIVRRRLPRISLGTVYRNLEILSKSGMVQKLNVAGQEMRFDGDISSHYHIRCVDCGRVADLELKALRGLEAEAAKMTDFEVLGHRLEFEGRCRDCQGGLRAAM
ncbi:MAG: transcriptional repressor [Deltaproteobacteria bacterium]|nr:transcriptional repressor [Deltaproteobacteria bacterium]